MLQNKLQSCASIRLSLSCLLIIAIILLMITTPATAEAENIVIAVYPQPSHTFVLTADGSLWAWGSNSYGKLGDGTTLDRSIPTQLILEDVAALYPQSSGHTFALKNDGSLWAWERNWDGRIGTGSGESDQTAPVEILRDVALLFPHERHSFALKNDGTLWAWGNNSYGQLGDGTTVNRFAPVEINLENVVTVVPNANNSFAIQSDGSLWAWGHNQYGKLGDGTTANRYSPVKVLDAVDAVFPGETHTLALKSDKTMWAWGYNWYGQLGYGGIDNQSQPVQVPIDGVAEVFPQKYHTFALKDDGTLWAWGYNWYGQLGDGSISNRNSPVQIPVDGVANLYPREYHTFMLKDDQTLWGWGRNWDNRLGDASNAHVRSAPVLISSEVQEAYILEKHAFAIDKDGSLLAWGNNNKAQLGNGSDAGVLTPESIAIENIAQIYAQDEHTFALKEDGSLWAWGSNTNGQLGIGSFQRQSTPVQVVLDDDLLTHIVSLTSEPQNGGTLDGDGTYIDGESVTVTATANPGYTFVNWTENNQVIGTNTNLSFLALNDRYLVANFKAEEKVADEEEIAIYEVKLNASPAEGGTVTGEGSYAAESAATIKATANEGYSFIRWNEKDEEISTEAELSFKVLSDRELTAIFEIIVEEEPELFALTLTANPSDSGTVEGGGDYEEAAEVSINATPAEGYEFVNWTFGVDGDELSTEAAYTYTMPAEAVTLVANFEAIIPEPELFALTLNVTPTDSGTVEGGGDYEEAAEVSINAIPAEGYEFVNWTLGVDGDELSSEAAYTYTMPAEAVTLVANFEAIIPEPELFTLELLAEPEEGGSVEGGGDYEEAAEVSINAIPAEGYEFVNWTLGVDGDDLSTEAAYTYTMPAEAVTIVANFIEEEVNKLEAAPETSNNKSIFYYLEVDLEPAGGGSVKGEGIYEQGDTAVVIADPDIDYSFYGWHENGSIVSFDARFEFTVERDLLLTAVFEPQSKAEIFDIILHVDPQGGGTVQGEGIYTPTETAVIVALPETQYQFDGWIEDGDIINTEAEYKFIVTGNRELIATFSLISQHETGDGGLSRAKPEEIEEPALIEEAEETEETYAIILITEPKEGGLVSGDGNYLADDIVGLDATPAEGYAFSGWQENGEEVSMAKAYAFTVDRERTLTATFSPLLSRQNEFAETYRISLAPQPLDGGRVYGGGEYTEGETITINALPNMDFVFQNWTENGIEVSSEIIYTFKVERDVKLTANFISFFGNNYHNPGSYSAADDFENFLGSYFAEFLVPTLSPNESDSPTLSLLGWTNSLLAPMGDGSID